MYDAERESMLTTQLAILESQVEVRDKMLGHLRSEISRKDVLIKKLMEASAHKTISYDLIADQLDKKDADGDVEAGTIG